MTLREMIDKLGANVTCPMDLENISFANEENISDEILLEYFSSSKFQNDVLSVMSKIHTAKNKGYYNFSLFFAKNEKAQLELRVFDLRF